MWKKTMGKNPMGIRIVEKLCCLGILCAKKMVVTFCCFFSNGKKQQIQMTLIEFKILIHPTFGLKKVVIKFRMSQTWNAKEW